MQSSVISPVTRIPPPFSTELHGIKLVWYATFFCTAGDAVEQVSGIIHVGIMEGVKLLINSVSQ
jgi:hypothetical protein